MPLDEAAFARTAVIGDNWRSQLFEPNVGFADWYLSALADKL
jgi:hypothetical protein